jgi:hypothetical protein
MFKRLIKRQADVQAAVLTIQGIAQDRLPSILANAGSGGSQPKAPLIAAILNDYKERQT